MSKGAFNGYLPVGDYTLDGMAFTVEPGQPLQVLGAKTAGEDVTVAGVQFLRRANVGGQRLELNGVGVRSKFGINVYVAALYLTQRNWAAHRVMDQQGPKRLVMHFTHRLVTREQMADQFRQGLANQGLDPDAPELEPFFGVLRDVQRGERLVWETVPGEGSTVRLGRDAPVHLPAESFARAWLGIFLGSQPASEPLKQGLLGGLR